MIGVSGDFPLNDDFAYARTTQTLLETGRFERSEWTYAPIVSHVGLGWLFASAFGFSFESLRLSGLFMGWLGVLCAYGLARQLRIDPGASLVAALTLAANPLHQNLSYTFMTDVPFTTFCTGSLLLLIRASRQRSAWSLLAGGVLARRGGRAWRPSPGSCSDRRSPIRVYGPL